MMATNPYNKINPLAFMFRGIGVSAGRMRFVLRQGEHSAFDMCVFRRHLVDFLMEGLRGDFLLHNVGNDYLLDVDQGWDETVFRDNFTTV